MTVLRIDPAKLVWREAGGEHVALDLGSGEYLGLNTSAGALLPLLAEGATADALAAALRDRFDVDDDTARRDVDGFVGALRRRGLLAA